MLVSLRWLRDYIDITLSPEELADRLTMAGLEVDAINEVTPGFSHVVVAQILSIAPHPSSEKLSLCQVTTGDEVLPIVCGAPNIAEGQVVPLAKVGATIPGGYTIKSTRLRGEPSEGMLCSEEELGIGEDHTGIMILPDTLTLGEDLATALDLKDITLDIGLTPNRSDCLSIIGVAREIAAITGQKVRYPDISFSESGEDVRDKTSVQILNSDLCPRYSCRMITNVTVKPSPSWMRLRLEAVGLRAINNAVDVTNFVMMELGQPLHAFDFKYLEEGRIVVRGSEEGEEFISLDEKSRLLNADTLMICDGVKPVAIAGIMGGLNSEVVDDTDTILLESAYFNPAAIRRSARRLGMSTDAAFRFERGIDPDGVIRALDRAAQLMAELSEGTICKNYIDEYPRKIETAKDIPLRVDKVNEILGTPIDGNEMKHLLESLEMVVENVGEGHYRVTPQSYRVDIAREIDLTEEISRLYGYDKIPLSIPAISYETEIKKRKEIFFTRVREVLNGYGYLEVINYSFTTAQSVDILDFEKGARERQFVRIRNPLSEDSAVMRTGLTYGLLDTMRKNINVGNVNLKMFEIGKVFIARGEGELPDEEERIVLLLTGSRYDESWHHKDVLTDFYDMKGCVENLLTVLGIRTVQFRSDSVLDFLHPGRSSHIFTGDTRLGFIGEIHPSVRDRMDVTPRAIICELDLAGLLSHFSEGMDYRGLSRFPAMSRDVAFLVDKSVESYAIIATARQQNEKLLDNIDIFDVYDGEGIQEGSKSVAVRFTYRSSERTLTDSEVADVHDKIVAAVIASTGAKIRGVGVQNGSNDEE